MKTNHCELEAQRRAALAEIERSGQNHGYGHKWLARVEEAIARRSEGHILWLLRVAERRLLSGEPEVDYFLARAAEVERKRNNQ
ncbi:MAG: hypothetical protein KA368_24090 [Acidobacteria bacterium]|nr:hypothetical protein [Acidobacteriota bacterium]